MPEVSTMRSIVMLLCLGLTGPSRAASPQAPAAPEVKEAVSTWESDYSSGRVLAHKGIKVAKFGAAALVGGIALFIVDDMAAEGSVRGTELGVAQNLALISVLGGIGSILVAAPMTAAGTTRSHRALARGGHAGAGCGLCIASWVLAIPTPLAPITHPASFGASAMQRADDHARYLKAVHLGGDDLTLCQPFFDRSCPEKAPGVGSPNGMPSVPPNPAMQSR
jgi:hypothetical protein